jgi:hypothetical protein
MMTSITPISRIQRIAKLLMSIKPSPLTACPRRKSAQNSAAIDNPNQ